MRYPSTLFQETGRSYAICDGVDVRDDAVDLVGAVDVDGESGDRLRKLFTPPNIGHLVPIELTTLTLARKRLSNFSL